MYFIFSAKAIKIYTEDYLQCLVDSEPPATVTWYHNGMEISLRNKANIQLSDDRTKITFKNMSLANVGDYKCEIRNAFEETAFTTKVSSNGKIFFDSSIITLYIE